MACQCCGKPERISANLLLGEVCQACHQKQAGTAKTHMFNIMQYTESKKISTPFVSALRDIQSRYKIINYTGYSMSNGRVEVYYKVKYRNNIVPLMLWSQVGGTPETTGFFYNVRGKNGKEVSLRGFFLSDAK